VVYTNPLSLAQHVTVEEVIQGFTAVGEWRYSFKQKGQEIEGLSADGVQDGVRQMARTGEAIRCVSVHLERETDNDAFFIARAERWIIAPDGRDVMLDSTIRGKRIPKYETHAYNDDRQPPRWKAGDRYLNESWFEHGVTKASRNAEEALMPEALKQWMLAAAKGTGPAPASRPQQRPQQQRNQPQRQAPANVDPETGEVTGVDYTKFWADLRAFKAGPAEVAAYLGVDKDAIGTAITTQAQADAIVAEFAKVPEKEQAALGV
jgi:hypothetical protein